MVIGTPGKLHHCSNKCVWESRRSHKCLLECKIDEDSSCKEEKVEDFILKPEKLMKTKKLRAASPLSLSIFWAKKNNNSPWV